MLATLKTGAYLMSVAAGTQLNQVNGELTPTLEDRILETVAGWQAYTACALLAAGIIFAIYGWRISKVLAVVNFAVIGGFLGQYVAGRAGINELASTAGLAVVLGALCIWQTRHGVSLLAGGAGAILGAALAHSLGAADAWVWTGVLVGFVTFALLAFIIYKVAAILYSSVEGSALVVAGALSLASTQDFIAGPLSESMRSHVYILPIMLAVPTVGSIVIQQRMLKRAAGWSIDD
jgi:hypothetical protein